MPAQSEASNIQAGRSRHSPFRTSTQNTGLRCRPVLRISRSSFPCNGCHGYAITTLVDRYAARRCIWRPGQVVVVRWRWALPVIEAPGARTVRVAESRLGNGGADTPMPVLAPGAGKTKTARLWTYVRDERPAGEKTAAAVWFAYSEDRKGEHPRAHLKNFKGALQADAYAGFHHLYEGGAIYEVACWAHCRRKFYEIHTAHPSPITTAALDRIGALYGIEDQIRGKPVDLRRQVRQSRARPLLEGLRTWMEKSLRQLSPKSETAAAIRYALSRWRALLRYVDDGLLEIDNNSAERALRRVALGRENYLFAGADAGGSYCPSRNLLIN